MRPNDSKKYLYALVITALVFFVAISISNFLSKKRIEEIRSIQDQISTNILSSEVQTALLEQFSCKDISSTALSRELGSLGDRLSYMEGTRANDDPEVIALKRNYSLLEIKDFILMNRVREKCGTDNVFIIYFYGRECDDCGRQGLVLTRLRQDFPELRVYSFDYDLDLSAVQTLISINKVENSLPALLIKDEAYYGFKSIEDLENIILELKTWRAEKEKTKTASTTP